MQINCCNSAMCLAVVGSFSTHTNEVWLCTSYDWLIGGKSDPIRMRPLGNGGIWSTGWGYGEEGNNTTKG